MDPIIAVCATNMTIFLLIGMYVLYLANKQKRIQQKLEHLERLHGSDNDA